MTQFCVGALPDEPLAAAAQFHARVLPRVIEALRTTSAAQFVLVFAPADHTHRGWRLAAVQGLAREHAPLRINGLEGDDEVAIAAAETYLGRADGVTGQFLPLDGMGAGRVV